VQPPAVCRPSRPVPGAGSLSEHDMRRAVACARVRVGAHMTRLLLDCQNHVHQGAAQRPAYAGEPAVHHQRRGGHRQDARDAGVERVCRRAQPGRHDLRARTPVLTRAFSTLLTTYIRLAVAVASMSAGVQAGSAAASPGFGSMAPGMRALAGLHCRPCGGRRGPGSGRRGRPPGHTSPCCWRSTSCRAPRW